MLNRAVFRKGSLLNKAIAILAVVVLAVPMAGVNAFADVEDNLSVSAAEAADAAEENAGQTLDENQIVEDSAPIAEAVLEGESADKSVNQAAGESVVPVSFTVHNASVTVNGKQYANLDSVVNVPAGKSFDFAAFAMDGFRFEADGVEAYVDGAKVFLQEKAGQAGVYTVPASSVADGLNIQVSAVEIPVPSDSSAVALAEGAATDDTTEENAVGEDPDGENVAGENAEDSEGEGSEDEGLEDPEGEDSDNKEDFDNDIEDMNKVPHVVPSTPLSPSEGNDDQSKQPSGSQEIQEGESSSNNESAEEGSSSSTSESEEENAADGTTEEVPSLDDVYDDVIEDLFSDEKPGETDTVLNQDPDDETTGHETFMPVFESCANLGSVTVKVTAPEGALPEGTQVKVGLVADSNIENAVKERVESEGACLVDSFAVDVTLVDAEGIEVQPLKPVNVRFSNTNVNGEDFSVYHVSDDGSQIEDVEVIEASAEVQSFDVNHFSIYVVGGTSIASDVSRSISVFPGGNGNGSGQSIEDPYIVKPGDQIKLSADFIQGSDADEGDTATHWGIIKCDEDGDSTGSWRKSYGPGVDGSIDGVASIEMTARGSANPSQCSTATVTLDQNLEEGAFIKVRYGHEEYDGQEKSDYSYFFIRVGDVTAENGQYKVIFDANADGEQVDNMPDSVTAIGESHTATIPAKIPTREGYEFLGWAYNAYATVPFINCSELPYEHAGVTNKDLTLYAVWQSVDTEQTIQISFDKGAVLNGESVSGLPEPMVCSPGSTVNLPNGIPTRTSNSGNSQYVFVGWTLDRSGSNLIYEPGDPIELPADVESITLFAEWRKAVSITFDPNGGEGTASTQVTTGFDNGSFTISLPDPDTLGFSKEGSTFVGWSTDASGQGDNYVSQMQYNVSANTTLYAIWADFNSGASDSNIAYFYIRKDSLIAKEPHSYDKSAYYPENSKTDLTGQLKVPVAINNNFDAVEANLAAKPSDDKIKQLLDEYNVSFDPETQYIQWYVIKFRSKLNDGRTEWNVDGVIRNRATYTVEYDSMGGDITVPFTRCYIPGQTVNVDFSRQPTRSGYDFLGWSTNEASTTAEYTANGSNNSFIMPSENVTLYAVWQEHGTVNYTYSADPSVGGTLTAYSETLWPVTGVAAGSTATAKPGFVFDAWFSNGVEITADNANSLGVRLEANGATIVPIKTNGEYKGGEFTAQFKTKTGIVRYVLNAPDATWDDFVSSESDGSQVYIDPVHYFVGDRVQAPSSKPVRSGYAFEGWKIEGDNSSEEASRIPSGGYFQFTQGSIEGENPVMTLEAVWTEKEDQFGYHLTLPGANWGSEGIPEGFIENGTSASYEQKIVSKTKYAFGDEIPVIENTPVLNGYQFVAWFGKEEDSLVSNLYFPESGSTVKYPFKKDGKLQTYSLDAIWATIDAEPVVVTYDGDSHGIKNVYAAIDTGELEGKYVEQIKNHISLRIERVEYSEDGNNWSTESPEFTEAGEHVVYVRGTIAINGSEVTIQTSTTVDICKRSVKIEGNGWSDPQAYSGETFSSKGYKVEENGEDRGLIEGHLLSVEYSISGTDPGEYNGQFKEESLKIVDSSNVPVGNNYSVSFVPGTLKITAVGSSYAQFALDASDATWGDYPQDRLVEGKRAKQTGDKPNQVITIEGEEGYYLIKGTFHENDEVKIPQTTPTRPGYTFVGWKAENETYNPGVTINYPYGQNEYDNDVLTIHAIWELDNSTNPGGAQGEDGGNPTNPGADDQESPDCPGVDPDNPNNPGTDNPNTDVPDGDDPDGGNGPDAVNPDGANPGADGNPGAGTPGGAGPDATVPSGTNGATTNGFAPESAAPVATAPQRTVIPGVSTPLDPVAETVVTPLASAMGGAVEAVIPDDATPLAEESISDDATPLASRGTQQPDGQDGHADCWVHWCMILGALVSAVYFTIVGVRRKKHEADLHGFESRVLEGCQRGAHAAEETTEE